MFLSNIVAPGYQGWEMHMWGIKNDQYQDVTDKEIADPAFNPVIVFRPRWGSMASTPIVYEDGALFFVYIDVITEEQVKERVELMNDGYNKLLVEAENALKKHFQK